MSNNQKQYTFTLPVGTILTGGQNSYHVEDVLGQGGYGITYKVWAIIKNGQIPVKVPFAVKEHFVNGRCHRAADGITVEYSQEAAEDVEESLKDFVKEGRLLNKICQADDEAVRYIVPVNEVIETNNTAYFVMQYLEGGSLRRMVLNSGAMTEERALTLINPIARAVDFIHHHKVLHMDIKPENIVMHRDLMTGQEEPVLIDFGVSLHFNKKGGLTSKHTSIGHTEGFSPIEQYGAVETFAPWIDVYALGATLYYLLTGKIPPSAFSITSDIIDTNLPSNVSHRTRAAIKHAMAKDYHDRTQSASTFLWELENDYEPVVEETSDGQKDVVDTNVTVKKKPAQTEGTNLQPPTPPTPNRKWIRLLAVGIAIVAVLGAYLKFGPKSAQNVINPNDPMHEIWIADSIEKARMDSIEKVRMDSIAMEEAKKQRERARQDPIDKARRDSVIKSKMEEAAHQNETGNKPQKETKAEAKPDKKAKPEPKQKVLSDAEVFAKAKASGDWATIEALGNKGYSSAYYELARHYYKDDPNEDKCRKWANKAVSAGIQVEEAKIFLNGIK